MIRRENRPYQPRKPPQERVEKAGLGINEDQFKEVYGDVYRKLYAIENEGGGNEYRVK